MSKLAVVGKGTAGSLSLLHYLHYTDFEIDWVYDPNTKAVAVGEGTDVRIPTELGAKINFNAQSLLDIGGSPKIGIQKENWNGAGSYLNPFSPGQMGYHIDAVKLQEWIFERVKDRVNLVERNVSDPDEVDADFVMMATGTPKELPDETFYKSEYVPVNAAYITQCDWDYSKFSYTLTIARPWGWVFGIPLQHRCSIGYLFNRDITDLDTVKEDVKTVFETYGLTPSDRTSYIKFENYYRKEPVGSRVSYNGNNCFFLEPLEATSLSTAYHIDTLAYRNWINNYPLELCNTLFEDFMDGVESTIALHYFAGSKFKNEFWDMAEEKGRKKLEQVWNTDRKGFILNACDYMDWDGEDNTCFGTWSNNIWNINIDKLGVKQKLLYM